MLTFSPTTADDRDEVERIFGASYPALLAGSYAPEVLKAVLPKIVLAQEALLTSGTFLIGKEADGTVVVAGGWTPTAPGTGDHTPGIVHIRHVAVDPQRTSRGYGRALVQRLMKDARDAGFTRVEVMSTVNAEPFYAALGFSKLEHVDVPLGEGIMIPSIRMIANL